MKTVNYSFASNLVDFALSSVTEHAKKLDASIGTRTCFWKISDLRSGLELDGWRRLGFENCIAYKKYLFKLTSRRKPSVFFGDVPEPQFKALAEYFFCSR